MISVKILHLLALKHKALIAPLKRVIFLPQLKLLPQGDSSLKYSFGDNARDYPQSNNLKAAELRRGLTYLNLPTRIPDI